MSSLIRGFTLVEMAVVLAIIALIVGSIIGGAHLLDVARLNKVATEISTNVSAIAKFKDQYKAYPGDMPNATEFWGVYNATTNPEGTVNGNGDERIINLTEGYPNNLVSEPLRAWQQMAASGFMDNKFTGVATTPDFKKNVNVPGSIIETAQYYLYNFSNQSDPGGNTEVYSIYGVSGNALQLGSNNTTTRPFGAAITPSDAHLIDKKIDDGLASSSKLFAVRGNEYKSVVSCVDVDYTSSLASYILTDPDATCRIIYWLDL